MEGSLVAFAAWETFEDSYYLWELQVHPDFQGRNIGSALLRECGALGAETQSTCTSTWNLAARGQAITFYLNRGFQVVDDSDKLVPFSESFITANTPLKMIKVPTFKLPNLRPNIELPGVSATRKAGGVSQTNEQDAAAHLEALHKNFHGWQCKSSVAAKSGQDCCLDAFNVKQFRALHRETYGQDDSKPVSLSEVSRNIHTALWALRKPLPDAPDGHGRHFRIHAFSLCGIEVCKACWHKARGGSRHLLRTRISHVNRGHGPDTIDNVKAAKVAVRIMQQSACARSERTGWTENWWKLHLLIHDFMPNEMMIQYRGPGWKTVHEMLYNPAAKISGVRPLAYKGWKKCIPAGLRLAAECLDGCDPDKLRLARSARHSKFPECTSCQEKKKRYVEAMNDPSASPEARQRAYDDLEQHMKEWTSDRKVALSMKYESFGNDSEFCYECDDKCGSFWQQLPVDSSGRDNKSTATAKFKFAIQANVVVNGVMRLSIVPKHVATGGNFGATHLVMALWRAHCAGKLPKNKKVLRRHTDGGPDNVTRPTHVLHWLLVYIGCFEDLLWFRFESGHSHTEIADRLFAMLKGLFESDNNARVLGVPDFPFLEAKMQEVFKSSKEMLEVSYMLANWDFDAWFKSIGIDASNEFAGISFDNVFRYQYVGASHFKHGGVKVTYKERLSTEATRYEAEWKPIRTVESDAGFKYNETTPEGVQFIERPPDLRREPMREEFSEKVDSAVVCAKVVSARDGTPAELPPESKSHWQSLMQLFEKSGDAKHAGAMPDLPVTIGEHKFDGCPRKLLPMLKDLQRFARPLITWDLFNNEPPSSFPKPAEEGAEGRSNNTSSSSRSSNNVQLRDPRVANHVTHMAYSQAESGRDSRDMSAEEWATNLTIPVEKIEDKRLYLVELDEPDGEMSIGIVESGLTTDDTLKGRWFGRKDGATQSWGTNPTFEHYCDRNGRIVDTMDKDLFLYEIQNSDLTDASVANKFVSPRLNAAFMVKLRELAKLIKKLRGEAALNQEAAPLESPRPPESPPLVTLTPDLIRSQEFTLLKVKEACKLHKLRTGSLSIKADLLDLLLAFIILKANSNFESTLLPLPSMLFFESEKAKLGTKFDPIETAASLIRKWKAMDNAKRDPFVKRVADLSKAGEKSSAGSSRDAADGSGSARRSREPGGTPSKEAVTRPRASSSASADVVMQDTEATASTGFAHPIPREQMLIPAVSLSRHTAVPVGSVVLKVGSPWVELLVDGIKTMEIRGRTTTKASGTRVYFFKIGAGHVLGYATLHCVEGPLTSDRWAETRQMHCISGDKLPYGATTCGYIFRDAVKFETPVECIARGQVWASSA